MKPSRRERERGRDDEDVAVRVDEGGREREASGGDDTEAARESVHVVEQVERVREADEPEDADRPAERLVRDELDRDRAVEDEVGGHELGAELRGRMQVDDVVEQAEREDDRAGADDRQHLARDPDRADRGRDDDGDREAGVDPDPSERRRRARVPAVGARVGPERLECARPAQQPGDDEEGDRRRSDGDECVHGLRGGGRVWHRPQKRNVASGRTRCAATSPVQSRGVRLRRSDPLSRAVREPLPARPPREVQGIGPRAPVDARVARDADARLPRRLLGDVEVADGPTSTTTGCSCSAACRRGCSSRRRCSRRPGACSRTRA